MHSNSHIRQHLDLLYGPEAARRTATQLREIIDRYRSQAPLIQHPVFNGRLAPRDAVLITYGDQVSEPGRPPLQTLAAFAEDHLRGVVSGIHILPFYPYSSDDGFSVIDYRQVDPQLGDWDDVARLGRSFGLMFDAVINHISAHSEWFQRFLQDDPTYRDYFLSVDAGVDLSAVVRPRALPLLTPVQTAAGERLVWTTFSEDQIDLNFANPAVLLEIIDLILFYVSQGAEILRLDAIAYLWKKVGTPSIHLEETHRFIQLLRVVLDEVASSVFLLTETNVPHRDNLSYFGDGVNEAQMVYNFALPPLTLHTLRSGDSTALSRWAADLRLPSTRTTFFNFLASHDGIGLNPAIGLLTPAEIEAILAQVQAHGGRVSYKHNADGSQSPYELNINYFDALSDPRGSEPLELQVGRFAAAHAILMSLVGLPAIYFHSLFGSRSWQEGVQITGRNRTINRQKFTRAELEQQLADPASLRRRVFDRLSRLLRARTERPAFDPYGDQQVLDAGPGVFALWRIAPGDADRVLCLQNVTAVEQAVPLPNDLPPTVVDLLSEQPISAGTARPLVLAPYQTAWLG